MINATKSKYKLPLNLQTFADPEPNEPPADPTPEPPATVTMTQEELDGMIAKRLARETKKYADYDEVKTKLSDYEKDAAERQKAQMSEQERQQTELAEALKRAEDADNARKQALDTANQRAVKADFKLMAASVNIRADALEDAFLLADKSGISVDENGNVTGVEDMLKALIASKPYLVEVAAPIKPKVIGEPNNPKEEERKTLQAQLDDAKKRKDFSKVVELSNKLINLK